MVERAFILYNPVTLPKTNTFSKTTNPVFTQIIFLFESAGAAFILWLGLFIITRDLPLRKGARFRWQRPALLAGATGGNWVVWSILG